MLQAIGNEELTEEYRKTLKAFYSVLKTQDGYIKFGFLTGVTKFGKVSVFSDLNNLNDISMDARYQTICGITEEALQQIEDKGYAKPFDMDNRTVYRIGVNFSKEKRCIDGWKIG